MKQMNLIHSNKQFKQRLFIITLEINSNFFITFTVSLSEAMYIIQHEWRYSVVGLCFLYFIASNLISNMLAVVIITFTILTMFDFIISGRVFVMMFVCIYYSINILWIEKSITRTNISWLNSLLILFLIVFRILQLHCPRHTSALFAIPILFVCPVLRYLIKSRH